MYFEAVFCFYVLLNHLIGHSLFRLVRFGSLSDIIKRHFAFALAKLHFYVDYAVRLFVGKPHKSRKFCSRFARQNNCASKVQSSLALDFTKRAHVST